MGSQNFESCFSDAVSHTPVWDAYWKAHFPAYKIRRDITVEADKKGIDVVLEKSNNERMWIDEKISHWKKEYPIELWSNVEQKKLGWAYTNKDFVAMVHVSEGKFIDEPILFKCDTDKFRKRIIETGNFETYLTETEGKYHTRGIAVPGNWLRNYTDDNWYETKSGNSKPQKIDQW